MTMHLQIQFSNGDHLDDTVLNLVQYGNGAESYWEWETEDGTKGRAVMANVNIIKWRKVPLPEGDPAPDELLLSAWGLLANVSNGNWHHQDPEWVDAAARWRDRWNEYMNGEWKP